LAAERVVETLGVDSCHLFRPDPGGGELVLMVGAGWSEAQVGAVLAGGAGSPAGYALARQEIVVSDCLAGENRFALPGRYRERGLTSAAVLPVMGDPAPYGVLEACRRDRPFRPEELWFLEALVQVLSLAVRRRQADEALRRSQEQLRQAQKMEAIGRLAGGVAHDFNNLLNVIEGTCELLLEDPAAGPLRRDLETIQVATRRGTELTRQLLAFSRRQDHRPQVVDLNQTVRAGEHLLQRLIGAHIDIRAELHPQPVLVHADPGHLDQVLMNLVVNARDAMPSGGRLVLETCPLDLSEPRGPVPPGAWVRLSVSDTGCGMDEETASRIFEPFFTTKEAGKGTGLGLSIVYGLVQQSGGHIEVDSRPGQGTRFHLYFPRVEAPPPV
ncbi:MAG TPA: ATP-binding protein, partial [Candidatus Nitrosotenuis sp.]|nr:ATP-binding protein [Candidatus Nitrosotenuis sp.]